jgi:hypothetical protein
MTSSKQDMGASFGPGSRPSDRAASAGVSPVPASIPSAATYAVHYSDGGERLAAGYDFNSRYWSEQAFVRCYESDDATIHVDFADVRWLGERLLDIASAIEARRAETAQTDSVHEGSVPPQAGDAQ